MNRFWEIRSSRLLFRGTATQTQPIATDTPLVPAVLSSFEIFGALRGYYMDCLRRDDVQPNLTPLASLVKTPSRWLV